MTGEPAFQFRNTDDVPVCADCEQEMAFQEQRTGTYHEYDVYACDGCGATFADRWSY